MKIYTKTGDQGDTSLFGGKRLSKADLKIDAYGTVDELNAHIGLVAAICSNSQKEILKITQEHLFTIGALLATPEGKKNTFFKEIDIIDIENLEKQIDFMNESLPELTSFILPGGHIHISYCQIARTVCRRAERITVALSKNEEFNPLIIKYLNRLSDYLFVLARTLAKDLYIDEIRWLPKKD